MKRRIIVAAIVLLALWILTIPVSYNLDALLSRRCDYTWNPIRALPLVMGNGKARSFLLLLMGAGLLAVAACLALGSNVSSRTGMQRLTPDIEIPAAAGQGQFGTARFLEKRKYRKVFTVYKLPEDGTYQKLLKEGKKDAEKIERRT